MNVRPVKTRIFEEGEDLVAFITSHIPKLSDGSVLVVTSKIVALAEGRTAIVKTAKEKELLIKGESEWAIKTKYVWLAIKDGVPMANAGIDESNADGKLILLPADSFETADTLRKQLRTRYKIKELGVIITDSRVFPLRGGVTGVALGYAGFKGVRDYRGKRDIFGKKFVYTRTDIADGLATASVVVMGEGNERHPLAIISEAPVVFSQRIDRKELHIDLKNDMYRPLFASRTRKRT